MRENHTSTLLSTGKILIAGGKSGLTQTTGTSELYDPTTGKSVTTGTMTTSRMLHTATMLPNGKVLVVGGLGVSGVRSLTLPSAELYDPVSGTWTVTGSLTNARYNHTANLLPNGKVLVTGGQKYIQFATATNTAEIYDPASGTWSTTGPLNVPRCMHTTTLLNDGTVLAVGGQDTNGVVTSTVEVYDPNAGTWSLTGVLNFSRFGHFATLMPGGSVLVGGGSNSAAVLSAELFNTSTKNWVLTSGNLTNCHFMATASLLPNGNALVVGGEYSVGLPTNNAEFYDSSGFWKAAGFLNNKRYSAAATLLPGGQIVISGGFDGTNFIGSIETYEPTNGGWTTINHMAVPHYGHTATLQTNGQVLVVGGQDAGTNSELYDPVSGNWTNTGYFNTERMFHTATLLTNGKTMITGGIGGINAVQILSSTEIYDPAAKTWVPTNWMQTARVDHTATLLPNGKVLVAGGQNSGGSPTNSAELFDPVTGAWIAIQPMVIPRAYHTATLLSNGNVLVTGGRGTNNAFLRDVETYNPSTGIWTTNNPMNFIRLSHVATLLANGTVLITGGYNPTNNSNGGLTNCELFDPVAGTWTNTGSMNFIRSYHVAATLPNGLVLVAGGYDNSGASQRTAELYDPLIGQWVATNTMGLGRTEAAGLLLPNGKVLMTGGYTSGGDTTNVELFDPGLGTSTSWQPQLTGVASSLDNGITIAGSLFRGVSEGSGGNSARDSAGDYPLVQLRGVLTNSSSFLAVTNWSTNSLATVPLTNYPAGLTILTVFVNGIPSQPAIVNLKSNASVMLSNLSQYYDGTAKSVNFTTVPSGLAVALTYNGFSFATNPGSYTVVAQINDALYQGGATNTLVLSLPSRNFGVDVSHYQASNGIPKTNWMQMYTNGNRFAFVKATEGLTGPDDTTMTVNVSNALQAGLLVGVYHFAHPENRPTTNGAIQEADHLLSYASNAMNFGMLRPVLDIETTSSNLPPSAMTDWVLAFSQEIVNHLGAGAAPILYCSQYYANNQFNVRLANTSLWIAVTGTGDPSYSNPPTNGFANNTGVFANWAFWQYNISGSAGGISPIDLDVCHDEFAPLSSYLIPTPVVNFNFSSVGLGSNGFQVSFTNLPGTHFTLLFSTNLLLGETNWTVLGQATEISAGQFKVVDAISTNHPAGYYRVRSP